MPRNVQTAVQSDRRASGRGSARRASGGIDQEEGLAVLDLQDHAFALPSRITATTAMGRSGIQTTMGYTHLAKEHLGSHAEELEENIESLPVPLRALRDSNPQPPDPKSGTLSN